MPERQKTPEQLLAEIAALRRKVTELETAEAERKRAEQALRESEDKFKYLFEHSMVGKSLTLPTGEIDVNQAFCEMLGYSADELRRRRWQDISPPEDIPGTQSQLEPLLSGERDSARFVKRYLHKNGSIVWADVTTFLRRDAQGEPMYFITSALDITERKQAEEALRESETRYRAIVEAFDGLIYVCSQDYRVEFMNSRLLERTGHDGTGELCYKVLHDRDSLCPWCVNDRVFAGETVRWEVQSPKDGRWFYVVNTPIFHTDGSMSKQAMILDITERKRGEEALHESEERYRALYEDNPCMYFTVDPAGTVLSVNRFGCQQLGYSAEELVGQSVLGVFHDDDKDAAARNLARCVENPGRVLHWELRKVHKAGRVMWVKETSRAIPGSDGQLVVFIVCEDITERRRAEEEKRQLESQLLQAQKMESVGRLAGGVAHDFNNMLAVILGRTELALRTITASDPLRRDLEEIERAAQRSADLTRQLLAFARKQTIAPAIVDLNGIVSSMLNMLRRLIGEDIDLAWKPGAELWHVRMDPGQVDQVLANLCVNARDAIAGVGRVTIETENVVFDEDYCATHADFFPGDHVMLAVSDDGCGMDEETRGHVFEPFFTTKGTGQGTGLGLATVYGIVKQNEGFINVYSEPGRGTTFKIYLRRCGGEATKAGASAAAGMPRGRGEVVLLVEDEPGMLRLCRKMLEELGYRVLAASAPSRAIRMAEEHGGEIGLLVTDVVMPEMNGPDLLRLLSPLQPNVRCLFMSGYTANVIGHRGVLQEGVRFLQKPFSLRDLAARVREALDAPPPDRTGV